VPPERRPAGAVRIFRRQRIAVAKEVILTREGFEKLKDEIEELSTVRRREVAERIKEAREFGDISENSEYDDAKNEQAMLEARIAQLEERLRDATVIEADDLSTDVVALGAHVTIDGPAGKATYQLVGSAEADPDELRLSNESPIGKAIMGRKKGDAVDVVTPGGQVSVKIVAIKRA
jgi:transcription elongation factor GreA